DEPPPIGVAAAGENAAGLAGRIGDALIATAPDPDLVEEFEAAGSVIASAQSEQFAGFPSMRRTARSDASVAVGQESDGRRRPAVLPAQRVHRQAARSSRRPSLYSASRAPRAAERLARAPRRSQHPRRRS